jgi:hypothetical protein
MFWHLYVKKLCEQNCFEGDSPVLLHVEILVFGISVKLTNSKFWCVYIKFQNLMCVRGIKLKMCTSTSKDVLDIHGSLHHNINLIEITNKIRPCSRIYYSNVS